MQSTDLVPACAGLARWKESWAKEQRCCQCFRPRREFPDLCPSCPHPGVSEFMLLCMCHVLSKLLSMPWTLEWASLCVGPLKVHVSVSRNPLSFSYTFFTGFHSQMWWGLSPGTGALGWDFGVGMGPALQKEGSSEEVSQLSYPYS